MTIAEITEKIGGVLEGDGSVEITGMSGLQEASAGDISFLSNPRYFSAVAETKASAVVVAEDWSGNSKCAVIRVADPDAAFAKIAGLLGPDEPLPEKGVHETAVVAADAELGQYVCIGPHCVIEPGARIGDRTVLMAGCYVGHETVIGSDSRIYPHVSIRERTVMGDRIIVHNGAVIGSDGFGNYRENGRWKKIPQTGIVVIGNDVEIGANVTIDRARFGKTVIGDNVKIDNLVQVAHNVHIGENTAMAAQSGLSGSAQIGRNVMLGGQVGVIGHIRIGDNSIVGGQAGVTKDVKPGSFVSGYPAMPHKEAAQLRANIKRIPLLKKRLRALEKRLEEIEKQQKGKKES